jgi:hypothetical protein
VRANEPTIDALMLSNMRSPLLHLSMMDILNLLVYFSKFGVFPYEYFYANKGRLMDTI